MFGSNSGNDNKNSNQQSPPRLLFGTASNPSTPGFTFGLPTTQPTMTTNVHNVFGASSAPATTHLFGAVGAPATSNVQPSGVFQAPAFGQPSNAPGTSPTSATPLFNPTSKPNPPPLFGQRNEPVGTFTSIQNPATTATRSLFQSTFGTTAVSGFASSSSPFQQGSGMFANKPLFTTATTATFPSVGKSKQTATTSIFGKETFAAGNVFGAPSTSSTAAFGSFTSTTRSNVFGDVKKVTNQPTFTPASFPTTGKINVFKPSVVKPGASGFQLGTASSTASGLFSFAGAAAATTTSTNVFASSHSTSFQPTQGNIFKKPVTTVASSPAPKETSHASPLSSRLGSKRSADDDNDRAKQPVKSRAKTKTEAPSSSRRPVLLRPALKAGLFGHALSDIQKSKSSSKTRQVSSSFKETKQRRMSEEESEARAKGHDFHTVSPEEILTYKSVVCKGIPEEYNNNEAVRKMFSHFGSITRIYCNPSKLSCIIHFTSHEAAELAKQHGLEMFPATKNMVIFWSGPSSRKSSKDSSEPTKPKESVDKKAATKVPKKLSYSTEGIDDELRSMSSGTSDIESQEFPQHPDKKDKGEKKSPKQRSGKQASKNKKRRKSEESPSVIMDKPTFTAGDRYLILRAQDKLLREKRKKQSLLATAKCVIGTCPDMCPEKERYMREDQRQLHSYEIAYNATKVGEEPKVDHRAAVKEYSRSSADQEEPLPHELRPPDALKMTMDYIICNIIDHPDQSTNLADWYDFIWNRTRSIRKDITQQHLCDLTCVDLVEKCARFHIHCAERLCEDSLNNFDPKINNENLTKCLQTLKHFYHDLGLKNITCPNEPEFRAYDVLLNLNDANILWEVQQLKADVQRSPQVRFALQAFSALNSNNYVRIFKLVREASYLNACIMHRYFVQVRSKALHTITRACSAPGHKIPHPVKELVRILGFEDEKETVEFCTSHGLTVVKHMIILDKATINRPEGTLPLMRSKNLIEVKCRTLVGEVVNNGPLPTNPLTYHQPHCSFDANGLLIKIAPADQSSKSETDTKIRSPVKLKPVEQTKTSKSASEQLQELDRLANDATSTIVGEEVQNLVSDIARTFLTTMSVMRQAEREVSMSLLIDVTDSSAKQIATETVAEEHELEKQKRKNLEQEKQMAEAIVLRMKQTEAKVIDDIGDALAEELVTSEIADMFGEIRDELELKDFVDNHSLLLLERLMTDVTNEETNAAIAEVYRDDVVKKKETLASIDANLRRLRILSYFQTWKSNVARRRHRRRNAQEFPSIPGARLLSESGRSTAKKELQLPTDRVNQQQKLRYLFDITFSYRALNDRISKTSINLTEVTQPIVNENKTAQNVYWKVVISLPAWSHDDDSAKQVGTWLRGKIACGFKETGEKVQLWSLHSIDVSSSHFGPIRNLTFCAKAVIGKLQDHDAVRCGNNRDFLGTHGILFALPPPHETNYWSAACERLEQILQLNRYRPPVPVVVLLCGWTKDEFDSAGGTDALRLESFKRQSLLSEHFAFSISQSSNVALHAELTMALKTLARHKPRSPRLSCQTVMGFLEDLTTRYFVVPIYQDLRSRSQLGYVNEAPDKLIALYNANIDHAARVVSAPILESVSWPVSELCGSAQHPNLPPANWNCSQHLSSLATALLKLKLPPFSVNSHADWASVVRRIGDYTTSLKARRAVAENPWKKIGNLLQKSWERFNKQCRALFAVSDVDLSADDVPWTEIVHVWADYRMRTLASEEFGNREDVNVYYLEDHFEGFRFPPQWRTMLREDGAEELVLVRASLERAALKRRHEEMERSSHEPKAVAQVDDNTSGIDLDVSGLLAKILKEKEHARKFQETLQLHLDETFSSAGAETPMLRRLSAPFEDENGDDAGSPRLEAVSLETGASPALGLSDQVAELKMRIREQRAQDAMFERRLRYLECLDL